MQEKTPFLNILVFLTVLLGFAFSVQTTAQVVRLNVAQLLRNADRALVGKCISVSTEIDKKLGKPVTIATFTVTQRIKGNIGNEVTIRQFGGKREGSFPLLISGMPSYKEGEEVILFLYGVSQYGFSSPVGLLQGKFLVTKDKTTGKRVAINGIRNANLFDGLRIQEFSALGVFSPAELKLMEVKQGPVDYDTFVSFLKRTTANLSRIAIN